MPAIHRRYGTGRIVANGNGSNRSVQSRERAPGPPLGLLPNVSYDRMIIKPEPGDLIVLYSDGVSEATNPAGKELGRDDLMTVARAINSSRRRRSACNWSTLSMSFAEAACPRTMKPIIVLQAFPEQSS